MNSNSKFKLLVVSVVLLGVVAGLLDMQNALIAYFMERGTSKLSPMHFVSSGLPIYGQILWLFSVIIWLVLLAVLMINKKSK